jgi:hypothetical protein
LGTEITLLNRDSEDFKMIELYCKNTHGRTHGFSIKIKEVFKIARVGFL